MQKLYSYLLLLSGAFLFIIFLLIVYLSFFAESFSRHSSHSIHKASAHTISVSQRHNTFSTAYDLPVNISRKKMLFTNEKVYYYIAPNQKQTIGISIRTSGSLSFKLYSQTGQALNFSVKKEDHDYTLLPKETFDPMNGCFLQIANYQEKKVPFCIKVFTKSKNKKSNKSDSGWQKNDTNITSKSNLNSQKDNKNSSSKSNSNQLKDNKNSSSKSNSNQLKDNKNSSSKSNSNQLKDNKNSSSKNDLNSQKKKNMNNSNSSKSDNRNISNNNSNRSKSDSQSISDNNSNRSKSDSQNISDSNPNRSKSDSQNISDSNSNHLKSKNSFSSKKNSDKSKNKKSSSSGKLSTFTQRNVNLNPHFLILGVNNVYKPDFDFLKKKTDISSISFYVTDPSVAIYENGKIYARSTGISILYCKDIAKNHTASMIIRVI